MKLTSPLPNSVKLILSRYIFNKLILSTLIENNYKLPFRICKSCTMTQIKLYAFGNFPLNSPRSNQRQYLVAPNAYNQKVNTF